MKIEKRQVKDKPLTVIVEYPEWNRHVEGLIGRIGRLDASLAGRTEDRQVSVALSDIYYIENVERKLFLYTKDEVYRYEGSMADVGENAGDTGLVRISRTCFMNTDHLKEIRQLKNSRLEAVMDNDEKLIVSRKYLQDIKKCFGRKAL
ncbi:MAG: LytTR family transcriptional regulator DNA-binding domain-containing protein [Lachnospiraceae bacterium]|nr:LytTR family transcriptional regulator DNA-binding domain-containing protein [Lachnospiraceae bacterium]